MMNRSYYWLRRYRLFSTIYNFAKNFFFLKIALQTAFYRKLCIRFFIHCRLLTNMYRRIQRRIEDRNRKSYCYCGSIILDEAMIRLIAMV